MTVAFFVSGGGEKVVKQIMIWKSKNPRCFKPANAASKLFFFCRCKVLDAN